MRITLQKYLCILFVLSMFSCGSQQRKPRLKDRLEIARQMVESRDFKVSFPTLSEVWLEFAGVEIPFYMRIAGDTLYSFMSYDVWTRPGWEYVYREPRKHGKLVPVVYPISNYEVTTGAKNSIILTFAFLMPLRINEIDPWYYQYENCTVYEVVDQVPVCCKVVIRRNGDVSVYFAREKDQKTFVSYKGYFAFEPL